MENLTIGGLARQAGVNVETIRYYQRRELLDQPIRPAGGIRRYGAATIARLAFIKRAQDIGFSLDEVKDLLRLELTPGCHDARNIAARKLALVDARIADLQRVRNVLDELISKCSTGGARTCPIIDALAHPSQGKIAVNL